MTTHASVINNLRQCQLKQLDILTVFDSICKKHNLEYWLDAGTLLGAVRHAGFIPWIFSDSPEIPDGSVILVSKIIPDPPKDPETERRSTFVEVFKETTAIIATSLTILVLATQLNK